MVADSDQTVMSDRFGKVRHLVQNIINIFTLTDNRIDRKFLLASMAISP